MRAWTDEEVVALGAGHVLTFDGLLGAAAAGVAAALAAYDDALAPATTRANREGDPSTFRTDRITWLDPADASPALAPLVALFEGLRDEANAAAWLGLGRFEIQLATYAPGARYDAHFDAFGGRPTRRLSALWYANADWRPEDGGYLRTWEPDGVHEVAPLLDRAVVFLSEKVKHEVLPAHRVRRAAAAWYRGRNDPG